MKRRNFIKGLGIAAAGVTVLPILPGTTDVSKPDRSFVGDVLQHEVYSCGAWTPNGAIYKEVDLGSEYGKVRIYRNKILDNNKNT